MSPTIIWLLGLGIVALGLFLALAWHAVNVLALRADRGPGRHRYETAERGQGNVPGWRHWHQVVPGLRELRDGPPCPGHEGDGPYWSDQLDATRTRGVTS